MRIEIDLSVANDPEALRWLDRILLKIDDGWHVWDMADQPDPQEIEATTWFRDPGRQGCRLRELLVKSVQRSAWTLAPHRRSIRVTAHPCTPDELTPEDASRLADEPLYILVENQFSDGPFVERVVEELDKPLHDLWKRPGKPVQIASVGGKGQMRQDVDHRTSGKPYRPRLVAIVDSDRKSPNDDPSRDAQRLHSACVQQNLPCWILAKREAENYLPRVLLLAWQNTGEGHKQRVDAWSRLSDDQKNFFDMKHGLPDTFSEIEQKLFDGLSPTDRGILSKGFNSKRSRSNVHECWTLQNVSAKTELVTRGQGDLEHGLELIRREV